jgi:tellurium resistance protein TerD
MIGFNSGDRVINLSKSGSVNLTKKAPSLKKINVGLGWDCNESKSRYAFDLDASVFMLNENGRVDASGFIFYGNPIADDGSVAHQGDNRTGEGDGDDEVIIVDLEKIDESIKELIIAVTIDGADTKNQNFGMVQNSFCRLVNSETEKEVVHFDLVEDFSIETAVIVGRIYRDDKSWQFEAIGQGVSGGLLELCRRYGLSAAYN